MKWLNAQLALTRLLLLLVEMAMLMPQPTSVFLDVRQAIMGQLCTIGDPMLNNLSV